MNTQKGTPTVIRHAILPHAVGMVITVSTPSAFTAHFHVYEVYRNYATGLSESFGSWNEEAGAVEAFEAWVREQGGYIA